jgi:hypothetical protein
MRSPPEQPGAAHFTCSGPAPWSVDYSVGILVPFFSAIHDGVR